MLPGALEKVGFHVFDDCPKIKTILVGNSSVAVSLRHYRYLALILVKGMMVGNTFL